jgi:diamine N-acetyltransferase
MPDGQAPVYCQTTRRRLLEFLSDFSAFFLNCRKNEMQSIQIRIAGPEDAEIIADMSRRTFYDTFAIHNTQENMAIYMSQQFTREKLLAEVSLPGRIFLLAILDKQPVGYASMREMTPPRGLEHTRAIEIVQIYSEKEMIGKGVGKTLMQRCLDIAREMNKQYVWLGVWEHNHRALEFYKKWGFEKFGEHLFIVGHDAQTDWWMKKKL